MLAHPFSGLELSGRHHCYSVHDPDQVASVRVGEVHANFGDYRVSNGGVVHLRLAVFGPGLHYLTYDPSRPPSPSAVFKAIGRDDGMIGDIATDGTYLYWTDGNGWVGRAKLDGTSDIEQFVYFGPNPAFGITVSGGTIYVGRGNEIDAAAATFHASPHQFVALSNLTPTGLVV